MGKKIVNKNGFSFVEVLVTLAILFLSLSTISVFMAKSIKASREAQNQIIATGLAEEGVEFVRNFKDRNVAFVSGVKSNGSYIVDKDTTYAGFTTNAGSGKLYLNNGGFFVHAAVGNKNTKFYRKLVILNDVSKVTVNSYVSWNPTGSFANCTIANKCLLVSSVMIDQ
ncbi:MAG: hypothetical protein ACD_5C00159G0002 [uncultured bacterium]|nr:MAG: hypothetical protein ACD_5C00159G0002 [uncultured bacterium]